jgi:hypothetical protein
MPRGLLGQDTDRRPRTLLVMLAMTGCVDAARGSADSTDAIRAALASIPHRPHRALCPERPGLMRCFARIQTDESGAIFHPDARGAGGGYTPSDLRSAYNLPQTGGANETVALIDARDDPNAEQDLAVYRSQYNLPPCTSANGCFKKVNQDGQAGPYPNPDPMWSGEIALDIEMVSAVCPSCKIILVEASSETSDDLGTAVNAAVRLGATAVSNSYGGPEDNTVMMDEEAYYHHPGVFQVAASGDNGYGISYPASSQYVLGVGGTSLTQAPGTARGWAESAWSAGGSGCSQVVAKPSWQTDGDCSMRTSADVAAVGDPSTGVNVYDSYGSGGWVVVGGTSAASPILAAVFALRNSTRATPDYPYRHPEAFYDVTTGSNGSCGTSYLCNAGAGYDGPTGMGTPNASVIVGPVEQADASVPDVSFRPDAFVPDAAPDAALPDATAPDAFVFDAFVVDAFIADAWTGIVDASAPDVDQAPDAGSSGTDQPSDPSVSSDDPSVSGRIDGGCLCVVGKSSWPSWTVALLGFACVLVRRRQGGQPANG